MAFGPEGIAAWQNMIFNNQKQRAERPYLNDMAKAELELKQSQALAMKSGNLYKEAMANYLQNPNMALKGFTNNTKSVLEQGLLNAPGGLNNLVTPPGGLAGAANPLGVSMGDSAPMPPNGMPNDGAGGLAGPMNMQGNQAPSPQQLPLSQQQIQRLQQFAGGQGQPAPMKLGMQNGQMATNQEVAQQTGGNANLDDLNNMYNKDRYNKTTDPVIKKRLDYVQHLNKTLDQIDPEVFTLYSGPQGKLKYAQDYMASRLGKASEQFKKYEALVGVTAPMFAGEIRQFQGDSVREGVREMFEDLANPATWHDPAVAAAKFNMLKTVLANEELADIQMAKSGPNLNEMERKAKENVMLPPATQGSAPASNDISKMSLDDLKAMRAKMGK